MESRRTPLRPARWCAIALLAAAARLPAQEAPRGDTATARMNFHESDFSNYRVRIVTDVRRYYPHSDLPQAWQRTWDIYFTQRIGTIGSDGIMSVDVNVDSMRLHVVKAGVELLFDSQDFQRLQSVDFRNPELVGTTELLNKPFSYRCTLDGDFLDTRGWEKWTGMIDSLLPDSTQRVPMEEYMRAPFLRELVLVAGGFTYNRAQTNRDRWRQGLPAFLDVFPAVDSSDLTITFPRTRERFIVFGEGTLHPAAAAVRDRGFTEWSTLDSLSGATRDTIVLGTYGQVERRVRTASFRAALRTSQFAYTDAVDERWTVDLLEYERR